MQVIHKYPRIRGVVTARAEGNDPSPDVHGTLRELNTVFAQFRQRNDQRVDELTEMVNAQQQQLAALNIGSADLRPSAGIRVPGLIQPLSSAVATEFRNMLRGGPNAAMSTQSGPDGGFTVPEQVDGVIDALMRSVSPMRGLARSVTLLQGNSWEKLVTRTGSTTYWVGEEEDRNDTDGPKLGAVEITPREVYACPSLTNHLLEDTGFNLNAFLSEDVAGEFALAEGLAFVSGDGVKRPRGFTTYATTTQADAAREFGKLQYVATGASGAFASSNPIDAIYDLLTSLRPIYRSGAGVAWLMNSNTANVVRKFKDTTGRPLWMDSVMAGQPDRLLGYPVAIDEGMPDIASGTYAIAFGNWQRGYAIVDKPGLRLIVDRYTKKGWTKFYFSRRVGGGVVDSNAIKLLKFSAS